MLHLKKECLRYMLFDHINNYLKISNFSFTFRFAGTGLLMPSCLPSLG